MLRIQFSSSASGPASKTLLVNPSQFDSEDSNPIAEFPTIQGPIIYQKKTFDNRPRTLRWTGFPVSNTAMDDVVTYCKSIEGQVRYINFRDIDSMSERWPNFQTWNKTRVVDIRIVYRPGGALKYDTVEVIIIPIP